MAPTSSPQTIAAQAAQGATLTAGILTTLAHVGLISAAFAPAAIITGAIVALTEIGFLIAGFFSGCGQTCVEATTIANNVTSQLQANLDKWNSVPPEHKFASLQAGCLNTVDFCFAALQRGCGDPALGAAGQRCISERLVRGGTAPWCPLPGNVGCDYYTTYRDPIANYTPIIPDPVVPGVNTVPGTRIPVLTSTNPDGTTQPAANSVASTYTGVADVTAPDSSALVLGTGLLVLLALKKWRGQHGA